MRDPFHSHTSGSPSPSPSPSPYPVSIRAYKKKDYEYLSRFPRMGHSVLRTVHSDGEFSQDRTDCDSDISMTASSVRYTTSNSSASSTSSAQSYAKHVIVKMDAEAHPLQQKQQQQEQQPQHLFLNTQISGDCAESAIEMKNNKIDDRRSADVKEDDKSNISGDCQGPIDEASGQVKAPGRSQLKHKSKPSNTPTVLPKFGSWDTRNPSSGDSYTLIFRRLREEKKSGGLPICTSPTHSKEGPEECLSQESQSKEQPNPRVRKGTARLKQKAKPHQDATYSQRNATRWSLCCKASVLDD